MARKPRQVAMFEKDVAQVVDDSIALLRAKEPPEGYFVAFSGGKDSIVMYDLVKRAGVKVSQVVYSATGIDPPEVSQFIRAHYQEVTWQRPKESFWALLKRNGPPSKFRRWCCRLLKESSTPPGSSLLVGVRAEESVKRSKYKAIEPDKRRKLTIIRPILHWLEWHIWDYIEDRGLPYPQLYDEGFERIGCVVCPFLTGRNPHRILRNKKRWPKLFKTFEKCVRIYWNTHREGVPRPKELREDAIWYERFEDFLCAWYHSYDR